MKTLLYSSILLTLGCPQSKTSDTGSLEQPTDTGDQDTGDTDTDVDDTGEPTPTNAEVIDCEISLPVVDGVCEVTANATGVTSTMIQGSILSEDKIYLGGSLTFDSEGVITCVGCECDSANATVITCPEAVVSPGLINPHDHIGFTEGWPIDTQGARYDHRHDWRGSLSTPQNPNGNDGKRWGEVRMLLSGVTSMVGSGKADGLVRNLEYSQQGLDVDAVDNETFPLGDANESFRSDCNWNYKTDEWSAAQELSYIPHIAEGINDYAQEEFFCQSQSVTGEDFTESNVAHVHSIGLHTVDYYHMARDGAQLVWSPRSNISLYGITADVMSFHRFGGIISLGTDWTYSGSMNELRELSCADSYNQNYLNGYFSDLDIWNMATINGARSLGLESTLGSLSEGKIADIAIYKGSDHRSIIEAGVQDLAMVIRGGEFLYGEQQTLSAMGNSCETIDVCGETRSICLEEEFDISYQDLENEVSGAYPAFFCEPPEDEPSCVPFRPSEFEESTSDDRDGDGIGNDSDNCPDMFNPIRPIDAAVQPDLDGDGTGDACDETPLPDDLDGDGTVNNDDNCPFESNDQSLDSDSDGIGDACDDCVDVANPEGVCPPEPGVSTTIYDIQGGLFSIGDAVQISSVAVTAVSGSGFTVQEQAGGEYSGVMVYTGSAPTVTAGQLLNVDGTLDEYYGETQLKDAVITILSSSFSPTGIVLTAAEAATENYEGVLVTIETGTVSNSSYDCSIDGSSCSDPNLWEISGSSGLVVYDRMWEETEQSFIDLTGTIPLTGVIGYRYDRFRIMPRNSSDF